MDLILPHELLSWTGGTVACGDLKACAGVFTDSRSPLQEGLFIALSGERFDGHHFVGDVMKAGAAGAVVAQTRLADTIQQVAGGNRPFFLLAVDQPLTALHGLARGYRQKFKGPVIAVTGSNGKTSTKEMITACVGTQVPVLSTHKNYNNEIGLPLTLLGLKPEHRACVVELAMRGLGQITQLATIALPDVAVVTNVGPIHLATLGSIENVALAKSELVRSLPSRGIAVLNADDSRVAAMASLAPGEVLTYGISDTARVKARSIRTSAQGSEFQLWIDKEYRDDVHVALLGRHNVYNALAALAATYAAGFDLRLAIPALSALSAPPMRMEITNLPGNIILVNDAYNASPLSMRAALEVLETLPAERHIAVLGEMLELGTEHENQHRLVGQMAAKTALDQLITIGDGGKLISEGALQAGMSTSRCKWYATPTEAIASVQAWVRPGDCVLIKASRGIRLEQVAEAIITLTQMLKGRWV